MMDRFTLHLTSERKIVIEGPPSITAAELRRLQAWVAVQFLIEDEDAIVPGPPTVEIPWTYPVLTAQEAEAQRSIS